MSRLEEETRSNMLEDQHGFTIGRSTVRAIKSCFDWLDTFPFGLIGRQERCVVGIFLDISGAFDNLQWKILIKDIFGLGASESTRSIIESYLVGRKAVLMVEKSAASVIITRGCP